MKDGVDREWTAWMVLGSEIVIGRKARLCHGCFDNAVSWYERNASTGALSYGGMLKDGVDGVDGLNRAKMLGLSSDGKSTYVTGHA